MLPKLAVEKGTERETVDFGAVQEVFTVNRCSAARTGVTSESKISAGRSRENPQSFEGSQSSLFLTL